MNPLAMPTTLAPRAATVQAGATGPENNGDSAGFAAALDLARDPASAAQSCRLEADADATALETGTIESDEHGDAADSEPPELSALLPGWPPTAWPGQDAPGAAAPLEAATERLAALRGERLERPRAVALTAPSAAEPIAAPSNTPASPRVTATQEADVSAAPSAAKSDSAAIAAPAPNTTSAQGLVLGAAPSIALFSGTAGTAAVNVAQQPFEAQLAAAIDSAAFAPALAKQVTWLAGEGVQQARNHLNPAEMGPLSVKIVLDGSQARIDFSADLAATRNAIEASLPTLAAALNDQGLTLAGGGVFDGQARHGTGRERAAPWPNAHTGAASTSHGPDGAASAMPPRAARGLVDLVA